ncbi:MAG: CDP-glycerol glycerophosphotransferase family protein, partial [Clostridiales bacterium]|nr:CDP-glycerol glycerophosphotransferase family protein [Clostridiales bacterium]
MKAKKTGFNLMRRTIKLITLLPFMPLPVKRNTIILEGFNYFTHNAGTFLDYCIEHKHNEKYQFILFCREVIPENMPKNVKCFDIDKPSFKKAYYWATAKFILADCGIPRKLKRKQVLIYLCHGSFPIKNVIGNIVMPRNINYVLSPSINVDAILAQSIACDTSKMIHVGYPVIDKFFEKGHELEKITHENFSKIILWLPTFRRLVGRVDSERILPFGIPILMYCISRKSVTSPEIVWDMLIITPTIAHCIQAIQIPCCCRSCAKKAQP